MSSAAKENHPTANTIRICKGLSVNKKNEALALYSNSSCLTITTYVYVQKLDLHCNTDIDKS